MFSISNMKVGARLGLGFGIVVSLLIGTAILGAARMAHLNEATDKLATDRFPKLILTMEIDSAIEAIGKTSYALLVAPDAAFADKQKEELAAARKTISENCEKLEKAVDSPKGKEIVQGIAAAERAFFADIDEALKLQADGKKQETFDQIVGKMRETRKALMARTDQMIEFQNDNVAEAVKDADRTYQSGFNLLVELAGLAVLLAIGIAWWLTRSVTRPLSQAVDVADAVAAGDLSKRIEVTRRDETGQLLLSMQKMVATFKTFTEAQAKMAKQHAAGEIDETMAADEFPGVYGEMAQSINALAALHIAVSNKVVAVVNQYAIGDLRQDMEQLPGKQAQFTVAVAGVKQSLKAVNTQIALLVDAAVRGDFRVRGDAEKYQHDFRKMIEGLNQLMQTADTGLSEVMRVLGALAKGDLTEKISGDYQGTWERMKDDANATVENLSKIVVQIKEASETINTASQEIATGNSDLSQRTEEQASSLEETAASMEELTTTVKQNADNAKQANQLAIGASDIATKGGSVVSSVVDTMSSINESSKKIVDIIGVIDGIAFQTNILALNAAVEAARAGEQGRGFAVVATEVRNLAQRSAAAAKDIKELIGDSTDKVETGTKLVDQAGKTMQEIVTSVKRVTDIMGEITAASLEQSAGIEQVSQAVAQMDEVTQQNAALVEQSAAAAESMEEQAHNLTASVSAFRLAGIAPGTASPVERRDLPHRPANVARLKAKAANTSAAKSIPAKHAQAGSGNSVESGEWEEF